MKPTLYDHQHGMVEQLRSALARSRRVILQAPPGVGKTRIAKYILAASMERDVPDGHSGLSLFAVQRRGLVDNASDSLNEEPELTHGIIMSGRETLSGRRIQVASIDTMLSWFVQEGSYTWNRTYDLIVYDECHAHCSKLQRLLEVHEAKREQLKLKPSYVIGLSATPQAAGLASTFSEIVQGPETDWLIENGYLSSYRYFAGKPGRIEDLVKSGDNYTEKSVSKAFQGLSGNFIRDWKKYGENRITIGFFPQRVHAAEAMRALQAQGIEAAYLDGETPDEERQYLYRQIERGQLQYLCNIGVVERGTDLPRVGCVQVCTAVGNVVRWRQMIGRGSRVHSEVPDCIVIDHGGNVHRLGLFEDRVNWTLDWSRRPSKSFSARITVECPQCHALYRGGKCRQCGYQPKNEPSKSKGLRFDGSNLVPINQESRKRSARAVKSNEQLLVSALYRAGYAKLTYRQALAIAYREAERQGTRFKVPKTFVVGGNTYHSLGYQKYKDIGATALVSRLYPFTRRKKQA